MQLKIGMLKLASLLRHSWDAACFKNRSALRGYRECLLSRQIL